MKCGACQQGESWDSHLISITLLFYILDLLEVFMSIFSRLDQRGDINFLIATRSEYRY